MNALRARHFWDEAAFVSSLTGHAGAPSGTSQKLAASGGFWAPTHSFADEGRLVPEMLALTRKGSAPLQQAPELTDDGGAAMGRRANQGGGPASAASGGAPWLSSQLPSMRRRSTRPIHTSCRDRERGAAMLIVLLILLTATAMATFAVHSVALDLRAAGHARQAMQTEYIAGSAMASAFMFVDRIGPASLLTAMNASTPPVLAPYEPELATNRQGYRLEPRDFADSPPVTLESLGSKQAYEPFFMVDVNDAYTYTGVIAGQRADGGGRLQFMHATYTARGRTRLPGEAPQGADARAAHEGASDARAHALSGPFGR